MGSQSAQTWKAWLSRFWAGHSGSQSAQTRKTLLSQFWAGHFPSDAAFEAFVREDDAYEYDRNHEDDGRVPLSQFAGSQGQHWYDHDFMEVGKVGTSAVPTEAICASFSESWAGEFVRRAAAAAITPTHLIMVGIDRPAGGPEYRQFPNPGSVTSSDYTLIYLGEIEFEYEEYHYQ
jgi:hypothetical protein